MTSDNVSYYANSNFGRHFDSGTVKYTTSCTSEYSSNFKSRSVKKERKKEIPCI